MSDFTFLRDRLDALAQQGLARSLRTVVLAQGPIIRLADEPGEKILFCSNDYLSLAADPRIAHAVAEAVRRYGYGAAASRLISGTMELHRRLEDRFAAWLGKEAALLFSSGFAANEALLRTLPERGDLVLLDRMDHASLIDGATAGSARFRRYDRNDGSRLERLLAQEGPRHRYIVTESVFSMDGDIPDLARLVELRRRHKAILILDEAHAIGCLGPTGAGLAEAAGLLDEIDIVVATLGKALAASGAIVAGPRVVIDYLINRARAFIYTTAPPPAHCAAVLTAMDILQTESERRHRLARNAARLRGRLAEMGLSAPGTMHIVPILLGSADRAVKVSRALLDRGYFVAAIRPPTVPPGTARLRVSLQADHTDDQIDGFCDALREVLRNEGPTENL